ERRLLALAALVGIALREVRLRAFAQDAVRVRDEFVASISHDLRSPLTAIKGYAELLLRRASRADDPALQQFENGLAHINTTSARMTKLLDELMDVSRLQLGQPLELDRHHMDLVQLARRVVEETGQTSDLHVLRLEAEVES